MTNADTTPTAGGNRTQSGNDRAGTAPGEGMITIWERVPTGEPGEYRLTARNVALRRGFSIPTAARLVGVARQTISRWVRDTRPNRRPLLIPGEDWGTRGCRIEIYPSAIPKMRTCIAFPRKRPG